MIVNRPLPLRFLNRYSGREIGEILGYYWEKDQYLWRVTRSEALRRVPLTTQNNVPTNILRINRAHVKVLAEYEAGKFKFDDTFILPSRG